MSWRACCGCVIAFSAAYQRHIMVQYNYGSGSTNMVFCMWQNGKLTLRIYGSTAWTVLLG